LKDGLVDGSRQVEDFMPLTIGLLMILTGFAVMAFGLFVFYSATYALIGFDAGVLLGRMFTGMLTELQLSSK
jgi:hypothetical protein